MQCLSVISQNNSFIVIALHGTNNENAIIKIFVPVCLFVPAYLRNIDTDFNQTFTDRQRMLQVYWHIIYYSKRNKGTFFVNSIEIARCSVPINKTKCEIEIIVVVSSLYKVLERASNTFHHNQPTTITHITFFPAGKTRTSGTTDLTGNRIRLSG